MKVSVITPSFNQAPFIERTIFSVLSQTWGALEYVVFDGGSTDGTVDILKKYNDRIRWVSEPDKGQANAINKGITATTGDIIGWLNSDDVYYPGAVQKAAEYLATHPNIDVVYGMADHIDLNDYAFETYPTEPWNLARLHKTCFVSQPAVFFRRSVVERVGLLDVKLQYCMDYEYWLRLGAAGMRFAYLEQRLAGSRLYAGNKTLSARIEMHAEINDMLLRHLGRVPYRWLYSYACVVVEERMKSRKSSEDSLPATTSHSMLAALEIKMRTILAAFRWNWAFRRDESLTTI